MSVPQRTESVIPEPVEIHVLKHTNRRVTVCVLEDGSLAVFIKKLEDRQMRSILEYEFRISQTTGFLLNAALADVLTFLKASPPEDAIIISSIPENKEEDSHG